MGSKNAGGRSLPPKVSPSAAAAGSSPPAPPPPSASPAEASSVLPDFHKGRIWSVDVAVSRPLVVTCGEDRFVRIFNFVERKRKLQKELTDDTLAVAMHPSGLYVVVGMADKLRLFFVMADDLLLIKEYHVPGCKQVSFSHGGQFFVVANHHATLVYETYTLTSHGVLKGHVSGVQSVCWSPSDHRIATAGADGAIYEWLPDKCSRDHSTENVLKIAQYTCIAYGSAATWLVASSVERGEDKVKLLAGGTCEFEMHIEGCHVTALALAHNDKVLLAATDTGCIRSYPWFGRASPQTLLASATEWANHFKEHQLHHAPITQMRVSPDQSVVLSCDASGTLCITATHKLIITITALIVDGAMTGVTTPSSSSTITTDAHVTATPSNLLESSSSSYSERHHHGSVSGPAAAVPAVAISFAPEVYVITADEFSEKALAVEEARVQLEDEKIKAQYELMRTEKRWKERVAKMEAEQEELVRQSQREKETHEHQMARAHADNTRDVRCMEAAHMAAAQELESLYQLKLARAEERVTHIKELLEDEKCKAEEAMERLKVAHHETLRTREEELRTLMRVKDATIEEMEEQTLSLQRLNLETERQQEEDMDAEIKEIAERSTAEIERHLAGKEDLRVQLHWMKSQFEQMQAQVLQAKSVAAKWEGEAKAAVNAREEVMNQLGSCKEVLQQREAAIERKEASLSKLRLMNKDLELHKFVLEDRINTLQRTIEPREEEVKRLRVHVTEKDDELSRTLAEIRTLSLGKKDREQKLHGLRKELEALTLRILDQQTKLHDMSHRISLLFETEVTPREREERLLALYREHCLHDPSAAALDPGLDALLHEVCRQRNVAEKKTVLAQAGLALHRKDSTRALHKSRSENVFLLTENMHLRRENKILANKVDMRGTGTSPEKARPATAPASDDATEPTTQQSQQRSQGGGGGGRVAVPPLGAAAIALAQEISAAEIGALFSSLSPNNTQNLQEKQGEGGKGQSGGGAVGAWGPESGTRHAQKNAAVRIASPSAAASASAGAAAAWRGGGGFTSRSGRLVKGTSSTALARLVAEEQQNVSHLLNKLKMATEVMEKQQREIEQLRWESAERERELHSNYDDDDDALHPLQPPGTLSAGRGGTTISARPHRTTPHGPAKTSARRGAMTARPTTDQQRAVPNKERQAGGGPLVMGMGSHTSRQGLWRGLALAQHPSLSKTSAPKIIGTAASAAATTATVGQGSSSTGSGGGVLAMDRNAVLTSHQYIAASSSGVGVGGDGGVTRETREEEHKGALGVPPSSVGFSSTHSSATSTDASSSHIRRWNGMPTPGMGLEEGQQGMASVYDGGHPGRSSRLDGAQVLSILIHQSAPSRNGSRAGSAGRESGRSSKVGTVKDEVPSSWTRTPSPTQTPPS